MDHQYQKYVYSISEVTSTLVYIISQYSSTETMHLFRSFYYKNYNDILDRNGQTESDSTNSDITTISYQESMDFSKTEEFLVYSQLRNDLIKLSPNDLAYVFAKAMLRIRRSWTYKIARLFEYSDLSSQVGVKEGLENGYDLSFQSKLQDLIDSMRMDQAALLGYLLVKFVVNNHSNTYDSKRLQVLRELKKYGRFMYQDLYRPGDGMVEIEKAESNPLLHNLYTHYFPEYTTDYINVRIEKNYFSRLGNAFLSVTIDPFYQLFMHKYAVDDTAVNWYSYVREKVIDLYDESDAYTFFKKLPFLRQGFLFLHAGFIILKYMAVHIAMCLLVRPVMNFIGLLYRLTVEPFGYPSKQFNHMIYDKDHRNVFADLMDQDPDRALSMVSSFINLDQPIEKKTATENKQPYDYSRVGDQHNEVGKPTSWDQNKGRPTSWDLDSSIQKLPTSHRGRFPLGKGSFQDVEEETKCPKNRH